MTPNPLKPLRQAVRQRLKERKIRPLTKYTVNLRRSQYGGFRWVIPVGLLTLPFFAVSPGDQAEAVYFSLLILWSTILILFRGGDFLDFFHNPYRLAAYYNLPIPDQTVHRWQAKEFIRPLTWTAIDWSAWCVAMFLVRGETSFLLIAPLLIGIQILLTLMGGYLLHQLFPRLSWTSAGTFFTYCLALPLFIFPDSYIWALIYLQEAGLLLYLPAGQVGEWAWRGMDGDGGAVLVLALLFPILTGLLYALYQHHEKQFRPEEIWNGAPPPRPGEESLRATEEVMENVHPVEPEEALSREEAGRVLDLLAGPSRLSAFALKGPLESWIYRILPRQDRRVVDVMESESWPTHRMILLSLGIILGLSLISGPEFVDHLKPILAVGTVAVAIPLFGGSWKGFRFIYLDSWRTPLFIALPLTFEIILRAMLLVNALRILAASPLLYIALAWYWNQPDGILAAKIILLLILSQPLFIFGQVGELLVGAVGNRWPKGLLMLCFIGLMITGLALAVTLFIVPLVYTPLVAVALVLNMAGIVKCYLRQEEKGYHDWMAP